MPTGLGLELTRHLVTFTPAARTATITATATATTVSVSHATTTSTVTTTVSASWGSSAWSQYCTMSTTTTTSASTCATPTGQFKIDIQPTGAPGYNLDCLTSTTGGPVPSQDHETMGVTTNTTACTTFAAVSNGQATIITSGGLTLYSDQDSSGAGNEPIYFDSVNDIQASGYGNSDEAVQFCLQSDNTFLVQNPSDGAATVQLCSGVIYLMTAANAASSGCTTVTLIKG